MFGGLTLLRPRDTCHEHLLPYQRVLSTLCILDSQGSLIRREKGHAICNVHMFRILRALSLRMKYLRKSLETTFLYNS